MTRTETITTALAMANRGGSFVRLLASALYAADDANAARLLGAFPEFVDRYGPGSHLYAMEHYGALAAEAARADGGTP